MLGAGLAQNRKKTFYEKPTKDSLPKPRRAVKNVSYDDANDQLNFNSAGKKDVPSFL